MVGFLITKCEQCDVFELHEINFGEAGEVTCQSCGATVAPLTPLGTIIKGKISRSDVGGKKGRLAEIQVAFRPQHGRNGVLGRHERVIDRQNNRYSEKVTLCENGEVTHLCEEPLTEHQGHGSAKKKRRL